MKNNLINSCVWIEDTGRVYGLSWLYQLSSYNSKSLSENIYPTSNNKLKWDQNVNTFIPVILSMTGHTCRRWGTFPDRVGTVSFQSNTSVNILNLASRLKTIKASYL